MPLSELDGFGGRLGVAAVGGDRFQDLQDLIPIAATAKQGDGKVSGHELICISVVWWGVFMGAPAPMGQAAISRSSSQR